jgi:hypothetical protein
MLYDEINGSFFLITPFPGGFHFNGFTSLSTWISESTNDGYPFGLAFCDTVDFVHIASFKYSTKDVLIQPYEKKTSKYMPTNTMYKYSPAYTYVP